jgi:hypothetical protein
MLFEGTFALMLLHPVTRIGALAVAAAFHIQHRVFVLAEPGLLDLAGGLSVDPVVSEADIGLTAVSPCAS